MNYWWVNQNQTWRHEIGDGEGYLWAPKLQVNGRRHFSYELMKQVRPGDVVFSYANSVIIAVGVAKTHCYSFPRPTEFGSAGENWSNEGWKVDVQYRKLGVNSVRTIDHISKLRPVLPETHSPMQHTNGHANQAYFFRISRSFAQALAELIDSYTLNLVNTTAAAELPEFETRTIDANISFWEDRIQEKIQANSKIEETEKDALIKARRGQGKYRKQLLARETRCRITGVDRPEHLIASHIKPWRSADNGERLDPENGFMLTPTIDHLFDKGFISFENDGRILLADVADRSAMEKLGVIGRQAPARIGNLSENQKSYLDWHRGSVLLF